MNSGQTTVKLPPIQTAMFRFPKKKRWWHWTYQKSGERGIPWKVGMAPIENLEDQRAYTQSLNCGIWTQ